MCNCEFAVDKGNGTFYCRKFRLFGNSKLTVCTMTLIEKEWDENIRRIPQSVRDRERIYAGKSEQGACFRENFNEKPK